MKVPFGEWLPDRETLEGGGCKTARNVLPAANSYLSFPEQQSASDALDGNCLGSYAMRDSSDAVRIVAGDETKLYLLEDGAWSDVSKSGGYDTAQTRWEFQRFGEKIIAVNINEPPQIINFEDVTPQFADLTGSPPQAQHIAVVRGFVVLGQLDESGTLSTNKIQWSGLEDETTWTADPATQSDSQILQGDGGYVQKIVGGEYGVIIQDNSIWRMTYVGPPFIFQFDEVETGRGTQAPNSVVSLGNLIYYLGKDGFYVFDGNSSRNISANKVSDYFFDTFDVSLSNRMTAAIDPINSLVIWSYHSGEATDTNVADRLIIYNWTTGRWSEAYSDLQQVNFSRQAAYTLDSMDAVLASIDNAAPSFDSRFWKGGALLLAGFNSSNELVVFTGEPKDAVLETDEFQPMDGGRAMIIGLRALVDGDTTMEVAARNHLGDTLTYGSAVTPDAAGRAHLFSNGRYHRVRVTTSGEFNHAQGVKVYIEPEGEY